MSLTLELVEYYLLNIPSLDLINNHDVKDRYNSKTNQTPLTIELGILWIDDLLTLNNDSEAALTESEENCLIDLKEALCSIPTSLGINAIRSVVMGLDNIQKELFTSVNQYIDCISNIDEHRNILKAIVLVLKILEYDLSKVEGPVVRTIGFWPVKKDIEILSDEKRTENHGLVSNLLNTIVDKFNSFYLQDTLVCIS